MSFLTTFLSILYISVPFYQVRRTFKKESRSRQYAMLLIRKLLSV